MVRPIKEPTPQEKEQVQTLSGYGLSQQQIATVLKMHVQTLRKWCNEEMKRGKDLAYSQALNSLFANIKKGKEASIFFYLKTQHQWRERSHVELSGEVKTPLTAVLQVVGKKENS